METTSAELLRSPAAVERPPAAKKQRGGATPRPASMMGLPPKTGSSSTSSHSGRLSTTADEAIARRRAELRRLQAKRTEASARVAANRGPPPSSASATGASGAPPPPMRPAGVGRHYSDLFPTVPKSPSPQVTRQTLLDVSEATGAPPLSEQEEPMLKQPPLPSGMSLPSKARADANSSGDHPPTTTTSSTPAVNRKLEFPSSNRPTEARARAKSAPPSRPPPPPPPPPKGATGMVATSSRPGMTKPVPSSRPSPMTPSALMGSSSDHATAPMPFSRTAERAQARKEQEALHPLEHAHSPHLVPSTKTMPIRTANAATASNMAPPSTMNANNTSTTPAPTSKSPLSSAPSSSKRDKINMMRNAVAEAESEETALASPPKKDQPPIPARRPARSPETENDAAPSKPLVSETQQHLEQAYNKAEEEKTAALVKIKLLEDQLLQVQDQVAKAQLEASKLTPPGSNPTMDYSYMLQLAETDGSEAALAWAKTQLQQQTGSSSLPSTPLGKQPLSAMSPLRNMVVGRMDSPRRRFKSLTERSMAVIPVLRNIPHNKPMKQIEYEMRAHFQEAAQYVPYEFTSSLATYVVRRPYGNVTAPELFQYVSLRPDTDYASQAHVSTLAALEVGVTIKADNSALLLFHKAGVRYKTSTTSDWKVVNNVEELDRPLGFVTYIDEQAKELEYSLDDILEEALMVREQYSSSMINTALGLKDRPPPAAQATEAALAKVPSKDVAVETEEKGMMTAPATTVMVEKNGDKAQGATKTAPPVAKLKDDTVGSSDMLTMLMSMILSSVLGLIYFVVIGLPLRIVQAVFVLTVAYAIFNMIYYYMAVDYNNWLIQESGGAAVSSEDLVLYYSNIQHGIM